MLVQLLIIVINFYQKFLSPYKGFCCAHRFFYHGLSCSEAVKEILLQDGIVSGFSRIRERFQECKNASQILKRNILVNSEDGNGDEDNGDERDSEDSGGGQGVNCQSLQCVAGACPF